MLTNVKVIQDEEPKKQESKPKLKLTAETIARNFGLESCDDFMTALKDTMSEED